MSECIFCGTLGNKSKEHFWPQWFRETYTQEAALAHFRELHTAIGKHPPSQVYRKLRQGSIISMRFRVVCANCNNGWMSALEAKFKPLFLGIHTGSTSTFSSEDLSIISQWVAMKVMVSEHSGNDTVLTPFEDRETFKRANIIPAYYRIYISKHNTETQASFARHSATVFKPYIHPRLDVGLNRNIQSISFMIGSLFIHVVCCRSPGLLSNKFFEIRPMVEIFPSKLESLELAALRTLDIEDLRKISNLFQELIHSDGVIHVG